MCSYCIQPTHCSARECIAVWREFIHVNKIGPGPESLPAPKSRSAWRAQFYGPFKWTFEPDAYAQSQKCIAIARTSWSYPLDTDMCAPLHVTLRQLILYLETAQYWFRAIGITLTHEISAHMGSASIVLQFRSFAPAKK